MYNNYEYTILNNKIKWYIRYTMRDFHIEMDTYTLYQRFTFVYDKRIAQSIIWTFFCVLDIYIWNNKVI